MHNAAKALALSFAVALSTVAAAQTATVTLVAQDANRLKAAENMLTLSDGRVIVTYNGGINELKGLPGTATIKPLNAPTCYYAGIVEWRGYIYASCSKNFGIAGISGGALVAAPITADLSTTTFKSIISLSTVNGPNGLAVSETGVLYLADSGLYLPSAPGKIIAMTLSNPTTIATQKTVYTSLGRPNGVRYDRAAKALYFSENPVYNGTAKSTLKRATVNGTNALSQVSAVFSLSGYLDDFTLTSTGAVLANAGDNTAVYYNEQTRTSSILATGFGQPTSMGFRCPTCADMLVTDLKNNAVYSVMPAIPLAPR